MSASSSAVTRWRVPGGGWKPSPVRAGRGGARPARRRPPGSRLRRGRASSPPSGGGTGGSTPRPRARGGSCQRSGRCAPRWSRAPRAWGRARAGSGPRVVWRSSPLPMLGAPVEADARIVVGDALLVGGVVALGGVVEERGGVAAEHAVAVRHAGGGGGHQGGGLAGVEDGGAGAGGRALSQGVGDQPRAPRPAGTNRPL